MVEVKPRNNFFLNQKKSLVDPPFDPEPYTVVKVEGTQVTIQRGDMVKDWNLRRLKLVKERPRHLVAGRKRKEKKKSSYQRNDFEHDDDWDFINLQNFGQSVMEEPCIVKIEGGISRIMKMY